MFVPALFIITKTDNNPNVLYWKCPLVGKWLNKLWYIYTKKYYRKNIINLKHSFLRELMQKTKDGQYKYNDNLLKSN